MSISPATCLNFDYRQVSRPGLKELLDRQDANASLTAEEREEAEGLVNLAEFLTLLRLRAERLTP